MGVDLNVESTINIQFFYILQQKINKNLHLQQIILFYNLQRILVKFYIILFTLLLWKYVINIPQNKKYRKMQSHGVVHQFGHILYPNLNKDS